MHLRYPRISLGLVGLLLVGSAGVSRSDQARPVATHPASGQRVTGQPVDPAALIAASPGAFVSEGTRVVTGSQHRREWRRARAGLAIDAASTEAGEDRQLEAEFLGDYAQGWRLGVASRPRAFVHLTPAAGARPAPAGVREDGAVLTFEEAFAGVTAAFGGTEHRLGEYLLVRDAAALPVWRYTLAAGPEFGHWVAAEGQLWGYDTEGKSLLALAPPAATDAAGTRVTGAWAIEGERGAQVLTARLDTAGLVYPLLLELSAEAPEWFRGEGGPSARAGAAGGYDAARGCVAVFGGAGANFTPVNEVMTRCAGGWQRVTTPEHDAPPTLAYATLTSGPAGRLYLFGGYPGEAASSPDNELRSLALGPDGTRGEWAHLAPAGPLPAARFFHGAAHDSTRDRLIIWGGVDRQGQLLADTWAFTASPPTWTRLCEGCFDARYGLTAVTQGTVASGLTISSLGGYDRAGAGGQQHNDLQRFDPACPGGACWSKPFGAGVARANEGPAPRFLAWGARDAADHIVWGSGLASGEQRLTDAWQLDAAGHWSPLSDRPGPRESALAVYHEAQRELVIVGGLADDSEARLPAGSLVHRGQASPAVLQIRQTAALSYAVEGRLTGPGEAEGYLVARDAITRRWEPIGGRCGTAESPMALRSAEVACTFVADRAYDLIDFRVREAESYSDSAPSSGRGARRAGAIEGRPYASLVSGCALPGAPGSSISCR